MSYIEFADEVADLNRRIADLRRRIVEPELLTLAPGVKVDIRPTADDSRINVSAEGRGFATVNYTSEGLIVDVFDSSGDNLHTACFLNDDLTGDEE